MKDIKSRLFYILHILMVLCVIGIMYSAFIMISDNQKYAEGEASYQQVRQIRESLKPNIEQPKVLSQATSEVLPEKKLKEEKVIEEKLDQLTVSIDFSALEEINSDVVAWIISGDTEIDYPVVLGTDNDYYLRHLFTGEYNKMGAIFMDYRNHGDFSDMNTILYGHNMKDGSMFSSLLKYKAQSYYDTFQSMTLYTPSGDFIIELFAGIVVDGDYESIRIDFKDDQDFVNYINLIKKASYFESNTVVNASDRIITLCTCSYEFNNARYALFGKLTPMQ